MKYIKIVILFICFLIATKSFAQGIYGFETGAGTVSSYKNYYSPTFEATFLKMVLPHISIGGAIDWRYFAFNYDDPFMLISDPNYGSILSVNQHSLYMFLSPIVDLSIGENQYFHINCSVGPGFCLYGNELTTYVSNTLAGTTVYNSINTSKNNNLIVFQYGFGASEYIPTNGYWSIKLSQQYSILGSDLNSSQSFIVPALKTNYYSFTIGISHYYHKIFYRN